MNTFMIGYVIVWLTVVAYVGFMSQRQRHLVEQYEELQRHLEESDTPEACRNRAA